MLSVCIITLDILLYTNKNALNIFLCKIFPIWLLLVSAKCIEYLTFAQM